MTAFADNQNSSQSSSYELVTYLFVSNTFLAAAEAGM